MQGIRTLFATGRTTLRQTQAGAAALPVPSLRWLRRRFARHEPTLYQRCLAVHIYHAGPRSALQ